MKKITLLFALLISFYGLSQTTFAIYTEDTNIGTGIGGMRFSNGQGFAASEVTSSPYQGSKNYMLTHNGTSSYFHAIFIAQNSNGGDITIDISNYSYYNIAIKSTSSSGFFIRMRGGGITTKVAINPSSNPYGYTNDGNWHLLSIPLTDFIPEGAFNNTSVSEVFVLRSNPQSGTDNNFEFDNIFLSQSQVLSLDTIEKQAVSVYPNPTENNFTVKTVNAIDNLSICNVLGQKVLNVRPKTNSYNVDMSLFKAGIYLVKVTSEGKEITSKLIKK